MSCADHQGYNTDYRNVVLPWQAEKGKGSDNESHYIVHAAGLKR